MYYIYENWVAADKAVIHKGSCSFCNDGKGIHDNIHGNRNGKWHGPFNGLNVATRHANSLNRHEVRLCNFCKP